MNKRNKWYIFHLKVFMNYGQLAGKIAMKEFDNELDLLVWASESMIRKGDGQHYIVSPEGVSVLPVEIYARIEQLKRDLTDKEAFKEERAIAAKEQRQREIREARKRKQEARAT